MHIDKVMDITTPAPLDVIQDRLFASDGRAVVAQCLAYSDDPYSDKSTPNAALLGHCYNHFEDAIKAIEMARDNAGPDDPDVWGSVEAVLAELKEVTGI